MEKVELTILIPCLNEEKTIKECIENASMFLKENNINGEILVVDNGSSDNSVQIAEKLGARVIITHKKGYGNALIYGIKNVLGKYTIMGDADCSYNFLEVLPMYTLLKEGYDLVIGNRYKGKLEKKSMKFTHQYIGTPVISFLAKKKFKLNIGDFNCGLRAFLSESMQKINFKTESMEFASEMIIKAKKENLKITELPINFYKDKRNNRSHMRPIREGIRHLKVIFTENIK